MNNYALYDYRVEIINSEGEEVYLTKDHVSFPSEIIDQGYVCSGLIPFQNLEVIGNIYEQED